MLKDVLRDTPMYQHILHEGREEGIKQGIEQGVEMGIEKGIKKGIEKGIEKGKNVERRERLSSLQRMIQAFIELRFPSLEALAKKQVAILSQPQVLENLVIQMIRAQNEEEAEKFLLQSTQDQSQSQ